MEVQSLVLIFPSQLGSVVCYLNVWGLFPEEHLWKPCCCQSPQFALGAVTLSLCTHCCGIKAFHRTLRAVCSLVTTHFSLFLAVSHCSLASGWLFCQVLCVLS